MGGNSLGKCSYEAAQAISCLGCDYFGATLAMPPSLCTLYKNFYEIARYASFWGLARIRGARVNSGQCQPLGESPVGYSRGLCNPSLLGTPRALVSTVQAAERL
jgi:hypothetical protein